MKKVINELSRLAYVAIRKFCGLSRGLITLPILTANANVNKSFGINSIFSRN